MAVDSRSSGGPLDARGGDGLARRDHAELRKAVEQSDFLFVEVMRRRIIPNFSAVRKTQQASDRQLPAERCRSALLRRACQNSQPLWPSAEMTPDAGDGDSAGHLRR